MKKGKLSPEKLDELRLLRQTRVNAYRKLSKDKKKILQPRFPTVTTKLLAQSIASNELQGYYSHEEVHDILTALGYALPRLMLTGREVHLDRLGKFKFKQTRGTVMTHAATGKINVSAANFVPSFVYVDELRRELAYKIKAALQSSGKLETDQYLMARLKTAVELEKMGVMSNFSESNEGVVVDVSEELTEDDSYSRKSRISRFLARLQKERDEAREAKLENNKEEDNESNQ